MASRVLRNMLREEVGFSSNLCDQGDTQGHKWQIISETKFPNDLQHDLERNQDCHVCVCGAD